MDVFPDSADRGRFIHVARISVLIKIGVSNLGCVLEGQAFDAFLQHPLYLWRHLSDKHLLLYVVDGDVAGLVVECRGIL